MLDLLFRAKHLFVAARIAWKGSGRSRQRARAQGLAALVRQRWPAILRVAWALNARGMLTGTEIDALLAHGLGGVHKQDTLRRTKTGESRASLII